MSEAKKSNGVIKPIIVGVATTVLTSVVLFHLGLDRKGSAVGNDRSIGSENVQLMQQSASNFSETESKDKEYYETTEEITRIADINGHWVDPQTQATYHIEQQGTYFTFQELSYGSVSAEGQGNLQGNIAQYTYATFMGTQGNGSLKFDPTNESLTSTFTDHYTGITQSILLLRE